MGRDSHPAIGLLNVGAQTAAMKYTGQTALKTAASLGNFKAVEQFRIPRARIPINNSFSLFKYRTVGNLGAIKSQHIAALDIGIKPDNFLALREK